MSWDVSSFREKIENEHQFPGIYVFKFIVPVEKKQDVLDFLPDGDLSFRNSSNNTYVSVTLKANVNNSQEVVDVYEKAYNVQGIVAL